MFKVGDIVIIKRLATFAEYTRIQSRSTGFDNEMFKYAGKKCIITSIENHDLRSANYYLKDIEKDNTGIEDWYWDLNWLVKGNVKIKISELL